MLGIMVIGSDGIFIEGIYDAAISLLLILLLVLMFAFVFVLILMNDALVLSTRVVGCIKVWLIISVMEGIDGINGKLADGFIFVFVIVSVMGAIGGIVIGGLIGIWSNGCIITGAGGIGGRTGGLIILLFVILLLLLFVIFNTSVLVIGVGIVGIKILLVILFNILVILSMVGCITGILVPIYVLFVDEVIGKLSKVPESLKSKKFDACCRNLLFCLHYFLSVCSL